MNTTEKIEASKQKKEQGNSLFKVGKYRGEKTIKGIEDGEDLIVVIDQAIKYASV